MKTLIFDKDIIAKSTGNWEKAKTFQPSKNLKFSTEYSFDIQNEQIRTIGSLTNSAEKPENIYINPNFSEVPFAAFIWASKEISINPNKAPTRPPSMRPPKVIEIPPLAIVQFHSDIELKNYNYKGAPTATVLWQFHYWNDPKPSGTFTVKLPSR